ncbi:FAD-dependent oxidoreductase [Mycoplasma sp. E35C]|uniref:FAD-dependent oxidoreductase n=1 Tax=Mycoplasma sp. E35C TaxID=2801918 RepID=UPI001CA3E8AE|nr:FAD-dependent oxidoreductase [Mycoplasma sp. E35C]QZX48829.1 FAD-dependent oxidoreductase [Mycoplasma sp. E35C]
MKVIVLGSSHGGFEACNEVLELYPDAELHWYEKGDFISFLSCGMQLHLEGIVKDLDTIRYSNEHEMSAKGVKVFKQHQITKINPDAHTIEVLDLSNNQIKTESYDKLIISPGSVPRTLNVPGEELENVYYMRGRAWAKKIRAKIDDPAVKNVVVIGSGYIGIEAAQSFAKANKNVTVVDITPTILPTYLDKEFTSVLQSEMAKHGVKFVLNEGVTKFEGDKKLSSVVTTNQSIPADLVIVAAGVKPNTEWLKDTLELLPNGFIKIDEYQRTSAKDVFAVGDATLIKFNPANIDISIALASNARKQGRYAAKNLIEAKHKFPGVQGSSALAVFDYKFASTGINEVFAKKLNLEIDSVLVHDYYKMSFVPEELKDKVMFKLIFDKKSKVILGAQIMAKHDLTPNINAMSLAILHKMTVDQLAYVDFFFQPEFDQPWNVINTACLMAMRKK